MAITFKRSLSPTIQAILDTAAILNSRAYNCEIGAKITLQDMSVLYYGTKTFLMDTVSKHGASSSISAMSFTGRLSGSPDFQHSQSRAPDGGELELSNLDYIISSMIPSGTNYFDNATVVVYLCFQKTSGDYEGIPYFIGLLSDISGDDITAKISLLSDMSNKGSILGKELTQRCLNTLGDSWCGVTFLPTGAVCTKIWHDKVGGCGYWQGVFNGAPYINPNGLMPGVIGGTGGIGGDGWDPGGCPDYESTLFPSANGGVIKGKDLRVGQAILNHSKTIIIVNDFDIIWADYRYLTTTSSGASLITSATHRYITSLEDELGSPVVEWKHDLYDMVVEEMGQVSLALRAIQGKRPEYRIQAVSAGKVIKLQVSAPHTYLAGRRAGHYLASHNLVKQGDPIFSPINSL